MIFEQCKWIFESGSINNIKELFPFAGSFAGGMIGGTLTAITIMTALFFFIGIYIYSSLAWYTIAKKLKHKKPWLAWIPIVNITLALQLGGFHWAWIFLLLIPIFGWIALFVIVIIAHWRIFEKRKYPGWFSLSVIIPKVGGILYLIAIGFLAWEKGTKRR